MSRRFVRRVNTLDDALDRSNREELKALIHDQARSLEWWRVVFASRITPDSDYTPHEDEPLFGRQFRIVENRP